VKNTLLVLADAAAVSQEGKLIIHGIFDHIRAKTLPVAHPSMTLVYQVQDAPPNLSYALRIRDVMNEKTVYEFAIPPSPESARGGKVGGLVQLNGMKFETVGAYAVALLANGEQVGAMTFHVAQA